MSGYTSGRSRLDLPMLVVHLSMFVGGEDVGESCAFGGVEL
jgi:hypothetical protein